MNGDERRLTGEVFLGHNQNETWAMNNYSGFRHLLAALPLHAEEDNIREDLFESELISRVQSGGNDPNTAEIVVAIIRRLFESLALLDPIALAAERWAFVSFPASLMARSILETMATPGSTFFDPDYWIQGRHRPPEIEEEQRSLLRRLENQRTSNPSVQVNPIRTVHVTWGFIKLGEKFLLHRREDKDRPDVGGYVFPGGRLNLADISIKNRSPDGLRDLFHIDSAIAKDAQERTLNRELREELDLLQNEYEATYQQTLNPFCKVEGTRNNHVYSQYNISIYTVRLTSAGELKVLDRAAHDQTEWVWFNAFELAAGKRPDGKRAFVDALMLESQKEVEKYLSDKIPDSSNTPPIYRTKSDAIELPSVFREPLLRGDAGRQKPVQILLDQRDWELLMLLGWHARGLEIAACEELMTALGGGWIKFQDKELLATASRLAQLFEAVGLRLVECDSLGHCRLSIETKHLYFQPGCFEYFWDIESEDKPIVVELKGINTRWATLKARTVSFNLSPAMLKAMPAIEDGREPGSDPDTIRREFKRLAEPVEKIGLHQFIAKRMNAHEILIPKRSSLLK